MKSADLIPLATSLAAPDFKAIEPHLAGLDKHLILRTYVDGYSLSEADTKLWVTLRGNKVANAFLKKGALSNLSRCVSVLFYSNPGFKTRQMVRIRRANTSRNPARDQGKR